MTCQRSRGLRSLETGGRNLLLIAARAPVPGMTKTRLGATIGDDRAAALYRAFLADLAARFTPTAAAAAGYTVGWAFTPATADFPLILASICDDLHRPSLSVPQHGDDWGIRQTNLLRWGQEHGFERTVLIASDSPQLPGSIIEEAFALLAERDVVIGPVRDGGYYLIGVSGFHDVLSEVPMSTASVADAVRARVHAMRLRLGELATTFDIDTAADVPALIAHLAAAPASAPATLRALHCLDLMPDSLVPVPASIGVSR